MFSHPKFYMDSQRSRLVNSSFSPALHTEMGDLMARSRFIRNSTGSRPVKLDEAKVQCHGKTSPPVVF